MRFLRLSGETAEQRFDREVLPHLDSAYNLARWLTRNADDAADVVQESCLRAFKNMNQLVGDNAKPWFLAIVRNTGHTFARRNNAITSAFTDEEDNLEWDGPSPEQAVIAKASAEAMTTLLEELPLEFREVIVLKDVQDLSYKEIADVVGVPIGTVMSRLNRGRKRLRQRLSDGVPEERRLGL